MKVYTTGQVSKICNVATSTVNKWFDSGKLKGFRIPGSKHRRIPRESLMEFLHDHGVPLANLEELKQNILVVSRDWHLVESLRKTIDEEQMCRITVAGNGFEAGIQADGPRPDCVVIDFEIGASEALNLCLSFQARGDWHGIATIGLIPSGIDADSISHVGLTERIRKPLDPALLSARIKDLASK